MRSNLLPLNVRGSPRRLRLLAMTNEMNLLFLLSLIFSRLALAAPGCPTRSQAEEIRKETVGFLIHRNEICSGTLISPHVVLTAAHCVQNKTTRQIYFTLNPDLTRPGLAASFARASRTIVNPLFMPPGGSNPGGADIALVKLESTEYGNVPATFYKLASVDEMTSGVTAYTLGYGVEPNGGGSIRRSKKVRFEEKKDARLADGRILPGGLLRFIRGDEGEIPCGGDSGSPVLKFAEDQTVIIAVYSANQALVRSARAAASLARSPVKLCKVTGSSVGTNVLPFRDWVEATRKEMETDRSFPRCP